VEGGQLRERKGFIEGGEVVGKHEGGEGVVSLGREREWQEVVERTLLMLLSCLVKFQRVLKLQEQGEPLLSLLVLPMSPSTVQELRDALSDLNLDSRGNKDTLKKRLARALKANSLSPPSSPSPPATPPQRTRPPGQEYDSFLVFDVEATCERIEGPYGRLAFSYPFVSLFLLFYSPRLTFRAQERGHRMAGHPSAVAETRRSRRRRVGSRQNRRISLFRQTHVEASALSLLY
jgi:hypothetical protein